LLFALGDALKLKWLFLIAVALLAAVGSYMISDMANRPVAGLDLARARSTEDGLFRVAIEPETAGIELGEMHNWIIILTRPDGAAVTDAGITIDGGMPDHNHGLPTSPQVTQNLGEGRYRAEGVKFSMRGWWELRLAISAEGERDDVTFNIMM